MNLSNTVLGLEIGSTRIKAVLTDKCSNVLAAGSFEWENSLSNGIWTYSLRDMRLGVQKCFAALKNDVEKKFKVPLDTVGAIGISGMMHGYLPFDKNEKELAAFRTWRNTITGEAAQKLSELFNFNIPQRWSIAHLYQAMLNGEEHLKSLSYITTAAGYIHHLLTGERAVGIGEASGMFPIDSETKDYDAEMLSRFDSLIKEAGYSWRLRDVLPRVMCAGECAGRLTPDGALFLDSTGTLKPGIPFAPPEGDAGTGMAATNSVRPGSGNVSAGTSDFAMIVVDSNLRRHKEIDMVTTPSGLPVAMVHCNNCTSDINAWVNLFKEFSSLMGYSVDRQELFTKLFELSQSADGDCGNLMSYNYYSGEGVTSLDSGRPLFVRFADSRFTLANFMKCHLFSALATLKIGLDILTKEENVKIDSLFAHGGFFKTPEVGQKILSAAVGAPVSVTKTAGEGGPYGMALLASYMLWRGDGESLEDYLESKVFADAETVTLTASDMERDEFEKFTERYKADFKAEIVAAKGGAANA